LLAAGILANTLTLDEFLPILYDSRYPRSDWAQHFAESRGKLRAFAIYPVRRFPIIQIILLLKVAQTNVKDHERGKLSLTVLFYCIFVSCGNSDKTNFKKTILIRRHYG